MKIAYCIAGHTRGYDKIISEANKKIKALDNVKFFISTWIMTGEQATFWQGDEENENPVDVESMFNLYKPLQWDMEGKHSYPELEKFNGKLLNNTVNVLNTLLMFKKIKSAISYSDDTYDVIVRGRFDIQDLNVNFKECEDNVIYGRLSPINKLPSDVFFYGNHKTMLEVVPDETFYTDEIINSSVNAEDIFKKYLESKNIEFKVDDTLNYTLKNVKY